VRDHRKLRAFEIADELALAVDQITKAFPRDEQFGLTSQMRRAAVSIASNVVEGSARRTEADYIRFLDMAHASARELEYPLTLAARLGYLSEADSAQVLTLADDVNRVLAGLLRSLRTAAAESFSAPS
jgi:four helix bundle protein